ncbi:hypothetical protein A5800_001715 [Enterococcus sp. 5B7_DIV0075]|nr:hypothetical protein A5800_001715 [Enterococcus sp. 5B7_DIV0075]
MYKPQYLNVERTKINIMSGNLIYFTMTNTMPSGYKKKPPEKFQNKSGRRFAGK